MTGRPWCGHSLPGFYLCQAVAARRMGCLIRQGSVALRQSLILFTPHHTHMLTGTVKFFDDTKGFGFILADDNQEEIFVHQTGLIHEIQEGDRVQFNLKTGKKGPNAVDVTRLQ